MPRSSVPKEGDPRRLARMAFLLYGPHHIEPLARLYDVDRKTIYRWRSGSTPVPAYVWGPLKEALFKHAAAIAAALDNLDQDSPGEVVPR